MDSSYHIRRVMNGGGGAHICVIGMRPSPPRSIDNSPDHLCRRKPSLNPANNRASVSGPGTIARYHAPQSPPRSPATGPPRPMPSQRDQPSPTTTPQGARSTLVPVHARGQRCRDLFASGNSRDAARPESSLPDRAWGYLHCHRQTKHPLKPRPQTSPSPQNTRPGKPTAKTNGAYCECYAPAIRSGCRTVE